MTDRSASVRNYALAALCIATIFGVFSFAALNYEQAQNYGRHDVGIQAYARCEIGKWATVMVEPHAENLRNVQCVSLNDGLFKESTIELGDLNKGSRDVCAFEANDTINTPPRFEITYNDGQTLRTSCDNGWVLE